MASNLRAMASNLIAPTFQYNPLEFLSICRTPSLCGASPDFEKSNISATWILIA